MKRRDFYYPIEDRYRMIYLTTGTFPKMPPEVEQLYLERRNKSLTTTPKTKESEETIVEKLRNWLLGVVGPEQTKEKILTNLTNNSIAYKKDKVIITKEKLKSLGVNGTNNLKELANLLGWEYRPHYSFRMGNKVLHKSVIMTNIDDLIAFLNKNH
jgi:hypothetical protein